MADAVASEAGVWRMHAAAAEDAAGELDALAVSLRKVLARNHFGADCVEGAALFERLTQCVGVGAQGLLAQAADCRRFSATCRAASEAYTLVDELFV